MSVLKLYFDLLKSADMSMYNDGFLPKPNCPLCVKMAMFSASTVKPV